MIKHQSKIGFIKIDTGSLDNSVLVEEYRVQIMPTFLLMVNGVVKKKLEGMNPAALRRFVYDQSQFA